MGGNFLLTKELGNGKRKWVQLVGLQAGRDGGRGRGGVERARAGRQRLYSRAHTPYSCARCPRLGAPLTAGKGLTGYSLPAF